MFMPMLKSVKKSKAKLQPHKLLLSTFGQLAYFPDSISGQRFKKLVYKQIGEVLQSVK